MSAVIANMVLYSGTKRVRAVHMDRLAYNILRGWTVPENENPLDEGYLVEDTGGASNVTGYEGYVSWLPKDEFERVYKRVSVVVNQSPEGSTWQDVMTFAQALETLKAGGKVARLGWNGKGMWIDLYQSPHSCDLAYLRLSYPVNGPTYPNGACVPWAPSQTDVLAEDWVVYP